MSMFCIAAGLILAYGALYLLFCIQKGGIAAALSMLGLLLIDLLLLVLLIHYGTRP